jgi:hypothetical protein
VKRTLLLLVLVVGAAVALAGAGPVTSVASTVVGTDEPDDGDVVGDADENGDDADGDDDGDDVDGDDADGDDEGDIGEGAQHIAQVIADEFGATQEDVLALHEQGIGFGAIFKLYLLAAAGENTVEAVQSAAEADGGFAFGKRFKEMADLESGPKNLGQIVSAAHHGTDGDESTHPGNGHAFGRGHGHGKPEGVPTNGDGEDDGHGPPEHAPAHGRR